MRQYNPTVLVRVFNTTKRHHDHGNSYKENTYLGWLTYSFRGSASYHHGKHAGRCGSGLESCRQQEVNSDTEWYPDIGNLKAHLYNDKLPTISYPHSNEATPPNSTTPHEIMRASYIQTTTVVEPGGLGVQSNPWLHSKFKAD